MKFFYFFFAPASTVLTAIMIALMMFDPVIPAEPEHTISVAAAFFIAAYMISASIAAWRAWDDERES